jgi:hypothetical protein
MTALAALILLVLVAMAGPGQAASRLHDPAENHDTVVHGVTNGQGIHRGPWVVQIAIAQGERLDITVSLAGGPLVAPTLRAIAGNGAIYRGGESAQFRLANLCIEAPVTGWITVHVDVPGPSEQTFEFRYSRHACE